jgi:hypothetical protein
MQRATNKLTHLCIPHEWSALIVLFSFYKNKRNGGSKMNYSEELCKERHKTVDEKLNDHEQRLNGHSKRIDSLENNESAVTIQIEKLCQGMRDLVSTIKWGLGILVTVILATIGFILR